MAQETRAQLYAKILANLPDNTTEQITPATDRAVEDAEVESCFNLEDDDATKVNYNPTSINADWLPEGDPSEVGEGLDVLAARTGVNLSQSIAYVSNVTTAGITPQLGNPLKPFATINDAITAVSTNSIVKVLGGTYTEGVIINKNNITLDISSCEITGYIRYDGDNIFVNATNAFITGNGTDATLQSGASTQSKFVLDGGTWDGSIRRSIDIFSSDQGFFIKNATFKSATATTPGFESFSANGYFYNCEFIYTGSIVSAFNIQNGKTTFDSCKIEAPLVAITSTDAETHIINKTNILAQKCYLMAQVGVRINKLLIDNSFLKSTNLGGLNSNAGLEIAYNCDEVKITNSTIIGGANCIGFKNVNRLATTNYILQNNIYYCDSARNIFIGTFNPADLGTCEVLGGTFNKAPLTLSTVNISTTSLTVTGLQEI